MSLFKTPLRYPGGKQKVAPFISEVMDENGLLGGHYAEPYAGGAGVAIHLLLSDQVEHVHLNDSSKAVYAMWRSILTDSDRFCRRILNVPLNITQWKRQREILSRPREFDQFDFGFSLFYMNRCNRSGIPSGGPIGGYHQSGTWKIDARFPRRELIRRVELIAEKRDKITAKNLDAEDFICNYLPDIPEKSLVYCDPPYFNKAHRLYLNHYTPGDHARISRVIQTQVHHPWVISYDAVPDVLSFYWERKAFVYELQYNAAKAYRGEEVFVFSDALTVPPESAVGSVNSALQKVTASCCEPL